MSPRLSWICRSAIFVFLALWAGACEKPTEKYNVLFIAVDDMNNDLGCYGHPLVQSPHIDRLASMGTRFERAYCQFPLCGPSRASVLTGLRPQTTRQHVNRQYIRENMPDVVTLPQMFRQNGYFSARVGKIYHYGNPGDIGTDSFDDPASWDYTFNPRGREKDEEDLLIDYTPQRGIGSSLNWMMAEGTGEEQTDGVGATEVIRLLEEHQDAPFFIAAGFYRPHCPFVAPKAYFDQYPYESIPLPNEPADDIRDIPEVAFWTRPANWGLNEEQRRRTIRAYYSTISFVDAQIGRLLGKMDELDLWKDTIVVFWSDHGYLLGEHGGQWMKQSLFEQSAQVPLIIVAPDQESRGRPSARIVELVDLYPTLAELTGLTPPENLEGVSLKPLLDEPQTVWDRPAFTEVRRRDRNGLSVRTDRWRFNVWNGGKDGFELYDHENDPGEYINLAGNPEYADVIAELKALIRQNWDDEVL